MSPEKFPCFGIDAWGDCLYAPAQPANIYFSVGEAIAALGFVIVILQFLKPIYLFRLRAYGIKTWHLFMFIFLGFLSSIIAALLPNLTFLHDYPIGYPIVWEIIGALCIGGTYAFTTFIALKSPAVKDRTLVSFVRAGASFLSEADDKDRVSFATDLYHNLPSIIKSLRDIFPAPWGVEYSRERIYS